MADHLSRTGAGAEPRPAEEARRSICYKLKVELRRLERNGQGDGTYATAIRRALGCLPEVTSEQVLLLLERELGRVEQSARSQRYSSVLASIFSEVEDHEVSCSKLFAYYLQRLEERGRGHEPFANALRRALNANGTTPSTSVLYWNDDDFES